MKTKKLALMIVILILPFQSRHTAPPTLSWI